MKLRAATSPDGLASHRRITRPSDGNFARRIVACSARTREFVRPGATTTHRPIDTGSHPCSDATVGDKESWTLSAYAGASSPASIRGLVTKYMASKGTTGPQNIEPLVRLSSTDYLKSPVSPDNISAIYADWTVNPATSAAWATSDLTSIQVGVRSAT